MRYLILVIIILFVFTTGSCKKCPCAQATLYFDYIKFQQSETDTVIIRRYIKGSGFTSLHDTGIINTINSNYYLYGDTMSITIYIDSLKLRSNYDYELLLPGANKLNRIHDIQEEPTEYECMGRNLHGCNNIISTLKLDGQPVFLHPRFPDYPTVYIRR